MAKPWGNIGAWAAESERAEAEEREQEAAAAAAASQSFPSLREAANTKQPKKKKMTLQEFSMFGAAGAAAVGLTPAEIGRLPTGPKERSAEEMQYGRLGGGFSNYGRSGGTPSRNRDRDGDSDNSWGANRRSYGGGFDDDRRGPPSRASDFDQPSRADEVDNWTMGKKSLPSFDSGRPNRYSSLGSGGGSRAEENDNWAAGKRPMPARTSNFGSSFRDSEMVQGDHDRPRLVLNPRKGDGVAVEPVRSDKPNPFGAARPREEVLAEKGLDWKKMDLDVEAKKSSRPTSSQSSRPTSAQSSRSEGPALQGMEGAGKPRPKVNPFGDAKPREVLLEEKGMDWRKIDLDLEHRGIDRPETEAEKNLKEEIDQLKKELEKESPLGSEEILTNLRDLIRSKENDLELLIRELDDQVRFGQKALERPPSRSGMSEESRTRNMEFTERSRSRGTGDMRHGEERRAYQGSRGRGFLGNRDMDRSRSRERW